MLYRLFLPLIQMKQEVYVQLLEGRRDETSMMLIFLTLTNPNDGEQARRSPTRLMKVLWRSVDYSYPCALPMCWTSVEWLVSTGWSTEGNKTLEVVSFGKVVYSEVIFVGISNYYSDAMPVEALSLAVGDDPRILKPLGLQVGLKVLWCVALIGILKLALVHRWSGCTGWHVGLFLA